MNYGSQQRVFKKEKQNVAITLINRVWPQSLVIITIQ